MPAAPAPIGQQSPSPKKPPFGLGWDQIRGKANTVANIVALFVFLVVLGGLGGYFYSQSKKPVTENKKTVIETLTADDLKKLGEIGANLGTTGQVLNIGADALFRGKADITGDLSIGGRLNANGPVTLSQLNITGSTAATGLNVGSNLQVGGTATFSRNIVVQQLATLNGGLNVAGAASVNSLNASNIAVNNLAISGPLTIGHLSTQGPSPTIIPNLVGAGGTVSISGNDTAGTINVNTGSSPGNVLATVTFRAGYNSTVHIQLTALTGAAASAGAFVTRNGAGFQIHANSPAAGSVLSFDYLVVQ